MYTKADFQQAIADTINSYPAIAPLYKAGDPRILQSLEAMATMLSMLSAQIETAQAETFEKSRDATVLADAAMRGIILKGTCARAKIRAVNSGDSSFTLDSGRTILDSSGRSWHVETAVTVPAGETGTFEATQQEFTTISHTVSGSVPFYAIEVPAAEDDAYLCSISVSDADGAYSYRDRYVNTAVGERVFHVEADERQRVYVRFGYRGVIGTQPADGTVIRLRVGYTNGDVLPEYDSPLSFEYINSPIEASVELKFDELLVPGQNPVPMNVLRDLAKYPSAYDASAVYLGEFDFLVRRNYPSLQFLSVWNECTEEQARGPSVSNVNCIFVACLSAAGTEQILENASAPAEIAESDLTGTQEAIRELIENADDSYRVRFFTPVISKIQIAITAKVSTSYIASDIEAKIKEVLIDSYGKEAAAAKRGQMKPLYRQIYALLREKVSALSDGQADLTVSISGYSDASVRPELWRYVDADSLTVTVETANILVPAWG